MSEQGKQSSEAGKYTVHHAYQSAIGDNATVNNYLSQAGHDPARKDLQALIERVDELLAEKDEADRAMVQPAVSQAMTAAVEIQQGDASEAKQTFLATRLQNIYRMAPDIGEVMIATLANPALGVAVVIRKIAQKAAEENGVSVG